MTAILFRSQLSKLIASKPAKSNILRVNTNTDILQIHELKKYLPLSQISLKCVSNGSIGVSIGSDDDTIGRREVTIALVL